jgi:hypothetical protein
MADSIDAILKALREVESGGDYKARASGSSASGAYQFIDSTWAANGGTQYAQRAYLATPAQQDEIARRAVTRILQANASKGPREQLEAVAQTWYIGHVASPAELDKVPPGNRLTVRQYTEKFLRAMGDATLPSGGFGDVGAVLDKTAEAVLSGIGKMLGAATEPFLEGLRRIAIIGLAVGGGIAMVVFGAWRSVRPASG